MKKFLIFLCCIVLIVAIAPIVLAITPDMEIPSIPDVPEIKPTFNFNVSGSFWDNWFKKNPLKVELLDTPEISDAKYVHRKNYERLEIQWDVVDGAERYEVVIIQADGTEMKYVVESNMIFDQTAKCPKMYVKDERVWVAATVKVRAIGDGVNSLWSDSVKISCDMLH